MKIVIIDNYDSFVFNIVRYINDLTQTKALVIRNDQVDYNELNDADAIVLSPGPGVPSEAGELMQILKKYHLKKPILGICLGHQAIGAFFGSELIQNKQPIHGKSTSIKQIENDALFTGLSRSFMVGRYHSWSINEKSTSLSTIAATPENEVMALKHRTLPIYGIQFHPESILTPDGRTIIENWIKTIKTSKES